MSKKRQGSGRNWPAGAPRGLAACGAILLLLALSMPATTSGRPALRQTESQADSGTRPTGPLDGRDFAGINLPIAAQRHDLAFRASRAWAWTSRGISRLYMERDVHVQIGPFQFSADRAVAWLEPVLVEGREGEQVAVYFEHVRNPPGAAGISQTAGTLLVTAIVYDNQTTARFDLLRQGRPDDPFVSDGEQRLRRHLLEIVAARQARDGAGAITPRPPGFGEPGTGPETGELVSTWLPPDDRGPLPPAERSPIIFPASAVVHISAPDQQLVDAGPDRGDALLLSGGLVVQYQPVTDEEAELEPLATDVLLQATRGAIFFRPGFGLGAGSVTLDDVEGVYLEGDVSIRSARYSLRGKRVYYDLRTNKAVLLDAVFWTYSEKRGLPLYLRADAIRQESLSEWSAEHAQLANVAFAEPAFSIGATSVTLTRRPDSEGDVEHHIDARGVQFKAGETSLLTLGKVRGRIEPSPLRSMEVESDDGSIVVRSGWDLFTLFGVDAPSGNSAELLVDGYFDRGVGVGTDIEWNANELEGNLFGYFIHDNGTDHLSTGARKDQDDANRGMLLGEQIWKISDEWSLFAEVAYISDETFVDAFFEQLGETRREFASSLYARRLVDDTILTLEVRGTVNDFISNEYLLQSLGYQTQKLPELTFAQIGRSLFDDLVVVSSETRLSRMQNQFNEPRLSELGFDTRKRSEMGFGLRPNDRLSTELKEAGVVSSETYRFDTRHEVEIPLRLGEINITPFGTGRLTLYDREFDKYAGDDQDQYRLWGAAGVRMSTMFQRVDNSVESKLFDLHRIRHLVEPNGTFWHASTNRHQDTLPIYDEQVESIAEGTAFRAGVRNTWQTMRGGPGRWRSVDWLVIDSSYTWSSGEVDIESPFGRFIDYRPEYSQLGRFFTNDTILQLTDAVAIGNNIILDGENAELIRLIVGLQIDHGYGFRSFVEYRALDAISAARVDFGASYELTRRYAAGVYGVIDNDTQSLQAIGGSITRRFPQWTLIVRFEIDEIADDFGLSVAVRPAGFANESRARSFTFDDEGLPFEASELSPETRPTRINAGPFAE